VVDEADLVFVQKNGIELVDRLYRRMREEVPAQLILASASMDAHTVKKFNKWTENDNNVLRLSTSHMEHALPENLTFFLYCNPSQSPLHTLRRLIQHGKETKGSEHRALVFGAEQNGLLSGLHQLGLTDASIQLPVTTTVAGGGSLGVCDFTSARGLHVPHLSDVYIVGSGQVPTPAEFLHMAGRTGRMGLPGDVSIVFSPYEARAVQHLCEVHEIPFRLSKC